MLAMPPEQDAEVEQHDYRWRERDEEWSHEHVAADHHPALREAHPDQPIAVPPIRLPADRVSKTEWRPPAEASSSWRRARRTRVSAVAIRWRTGRRPRSCSRTNGSRRRSRSPFLRRSTRRPGGFRLGSFMRPAAVSVPSHPSRPGAPGAGPPAPRSSRSGWPTPLGRGIDPERQWQGGPTRTKNPGQRSPMTSANVSPAHMAELSESSSSSRTIHQEDREPDDSEEDQDRRDPEDQR